MSFVQHFRLVFNTHDLALVSFGNVGFGHFRRARIHRANRFVAPREAPNRRRVSFGGGATRGQVFLNPKVPTRTNFGAVASIRFHV